MADNDKAAADAAAAAAADKGKGADDKSILDSATAPDPNKSAGDTNGKPDPAKAAADAAAKPAAGAPTGDDAAKKAAADAAAKAAADKPAGAPEKYEPFKVPEGVTLDPKLTETFQGKAKELNLSQEQAQKLVDFQVEAVKTAQAEQGKLFDQMQAEWKETTRKELGAEADKQLAYAAQFRDKFLSENARKVLNDAGLSNHPEIIKSFIQAGKALSEDGLVPGKPATDKADKSAAEVIFDTMGKKK